MAEEFRLFARTGLYVAGAALVYWLVSLDAPGTVLLVALVIALLAFVAMAIALAPHDAATRGGSGVVGFVNRYLGFHEWVDARPPLEGEPELVPLGSAWPIITAAGMVLIGLGLIFGAWLSLPGAGIVAWGGVGWLTQLDSAG